MTEIPPSIETQVEAARRTAAGLDDYQLDLSLAMTVARRDVSAAHGRHNAAAAWQDVVLALDDVRRARTQTRREIEDMTGPPIATRPLTAEELAECAWPDEPQEPPC